MAVDFDRLIADVEKRHEQRQAESRRDTLIRVWDGNWKLFATISGEYEHRFKWEANDTGAATVMLPLSHWAAQELNNKDKWPTKSMYVTFDREGSRWSGRVEALNVEVNARGEQYLLLTMSHDYQKLKDLLAWANPFLPAAVQFPKAFFLYGPARWAVTTTIFVNILRKNTSRWMIPDDPVNFRQWGNLGMSNWNMAVKPVVFGSDKTLPATISSRFKTVHEAIYDICQDARLSVECRRWLEGDPEPWPGAKLRHGCLVFDVVDKSGLETGTGVGGSMFGGIIHAMRRISSDGLTEGYDYINRVDSPEQYYKSGFKGTVASAPWVVLEHGPYSPIETSNYEYVPPGQSQFVTGGSSMPYVNEGIKAAIVGIGGLIGSIFNQSQVGTVAATVLEPLYSDVFMAFMANKMTSRITEQGWDYPFEKWVDGADKAYTLNAIIAMRKAKEATRERESCTVKMTNGHPYWVGENGHGDFFINDRVAVHALGMPEDKLFIQQVDSLEYISTYDEKGWEIQVGQKEFDSGITYLTRRMEQLTSGLKELGVW